ncbi:MAG: OmpA family protein [Rhodospirillales bacterium]
MAEKSSAIGKSILSAAIVAAILLPAGYVAFDFIRKDMKAQQSETRSVVMEIQTATVEEIRAGAEKTQQALSNVQGGGGEQLAADMTALKQVTEQILAEQKAISENLSRVMKMETGIAEAKAPAAEEAPPADFEATIYFGIGKASGSNADTQIAEALPRIRDMLAKGACRTGVTGFADTVGNDLANLKLSRARADYVAGKLRKAGLEVDSVEAWGERRLKVHTYDGVKNENNRRAEIEMHCGKQPQKAAAGA